MKDKLDSYRRAAHKAVDYQLAFQLPDGGYIWDGYVKNAFHKQGFSWTLAGRFSEAEKLMSWADRFRKLKIRTNADQPNQATQAIAFGAEVFRIEKSLKPRNTHSCS